mmetsp:Transcript_42573/g.78314  ORF Transcript_42573/g.78314 Transcript_42573/m.78314 type:complete len:87 (+) Transcript_42573:11-271(+)
MCWRFLQQKLIEQTVECMRRSWPNSRCWQNLRLRCASDRVPEIVPHITRLVGTQDQLHVGCVSVSIVAMRTVQILIKVLANTASAH